MGRLAKVRSTEHKKLFLSSCSITLAKVRSTEHKKFEMSKERAASESAKYWSNFIKSLAELNLMEKDFYFNW